MNYITDIFLVCFRINCVFALLVCLQEIVGSLGTGTMSYSSSCFQHLVLCLVHSRCSINVVKTNWTANKIQIKIKRPLLCSIPSLVQMLKRFCFFFWKKETEKILQTSMTWSDFLRFLASLILLEPLNPE